MPATDRVGAIYGGGEARSSRRTSANSSASATCSWAQMMTALLYAAAALAEITGCFSFWAWRRSGLSALVLIPGTASLILFAWLLTGVDSSAAGRAYAAYGGVYIFASLVWLWAVEGVRPDTWDLVGVALCLLGAVIIVVGHSSASPSIGA